MIHRTPEQEIIKLKADLSKMEKLVATLMVQIKHLDKQVSNVKHDIRRIGDVADSSAQKLRGMR